MRRHIMLSMLMLAISNGTASAEEPTRVKPKPIFKLEQVAALDPATTEAHVYCSAGLLPALVERCPALTKLTLTWDSKIHLADLEKLGSLSMLEHLAIGGDMSFPTSHFEVVGKLKGLKSLRLALY